MRYDGGHKLDPRLHEVWGRHVEYLPVCPEVELSLPVPRDSMRLVGRADDQRLIVTRTGADLTDRMNAWARQRVTELEGSHLDGFIFKSRSPSSGMQGVKLYDDKGGVSLQGVGLFAKRFMAHFPHIPVQDDERLHDDRLRESFIERMFVYRHWRAMLETERTVAGLMRFHETHELLVMAHSPHHGLALGQIVARADAKGLDGVLDRYHDRMSEALGLRTSRAKHAHVLQHCLGHFERNLTSDEKAHCMGLIEGYAAGELALLVPVTLIKRYARRYDQLYLRDQYYLHPHPLELVLLNHG